MVRMSTPSARGLQAPLVPCVMPVQVPVYIVTERRNLLSIAPLIALSVVAVVAGRLVGSGTLSRVPERWFRTVVAVLLLALGMWMPLHG
jgi:uncharacterized membrane protein YfcA